MIQLDVDGVDGVASADLADAAAGHRRDQSAVLHLQFDALQISV
jgi:hypothetical protein